MASKHERLREVVASLDDVTELPASAGALYALSSINHLHCGEPDLAYLKCKAENGDPMACVEQGKAITQCTLGLFRNIYASPCADAFKAYSAALEKRNLEFATTRPEQDAFVKCWESRQ